MSKVFIKKVLFLLLSCFLLSCGDDSYTVSVESHEESPLLTGSSAFEAYEISLLVNESAQMAGYTSQIDSEYLRTRAAIFKMLNTGFGKNGYEIGLVRRRKEVDSISHELFESLIRFPSRIQHFEVTSENQLLELAFERAARKDGISFLLSNGIMSFNADSILTNLRRTRDDDILLNNINNTENILTASFRQYITDHPGVAISLYAFKSRFMGKYFNAEFVQRGNVLQKNLYSLDDAQRPFYLWVIGSARKVADLQSFIEDELNPAYVQNWGLEFQIETEPKFLNTGKSNGSIIDNTLTRIDLSDTVRTSMAIQLESLPKSFRNNAYLNSPAVFTNGRFISALHSDFRNYRLDQLENVDLEIVKDLSFSHFFDLKIGPIQEGEVTEAEFEMVFTSGYNANWLRSISTRDDRDNAEVMGKTFGIAVLANQLDNLFEGRNEVLNIKFKVQSNQNK